MGRKTCLTVVLHRLSVRYRHLGMLVAHYLLIKFFGGLLVVKKPYLIQRLRLTL